MEKARIFVALKSRRRGSCSSQRAKSETRCNVSLSSRTQPPPTWPRWVCVCVPTKNPQPYIISFYFLSIYCYRRCAALLLLLPLLPRLWLGSRSLDGARSLSRSLREPSCFVSTLLVLLCWRNAVRLGQSTNERAEQRKSTKHAYNYSDINSNNVLTAPKYILTRCDRCRTNAKVC